MNYYGTRRMLEAFRPLLREGGRLVGVSSSAGQLGGWSPDLRGRMLAEDLTLAQLDAIAEEFVAAAAEGGHRAAGFPGSAYGASKALMTQLHRVWARDLPSPPYLCAALCPGLCRTYMATGRGTFMSNVLWLASFFVGRSAAGGADTPVWLAAGVPDADLPALHGRFVKNRTAAAF